MSAAAAYTCSVFLSVPTRVKKVFEMFLLLATSQELNKSVLVSVFKYFFFSQTTLN
jgi:hypothetical protein